MTVEERLTAIETDISNLIRTRTVLPEQKTAGHRSSEFKTTVMIVASGIALVALGVGLIVFKDDRQTGNMLIQEGMPMLTILGTAYIGGRTADKVLNKKKE